MRNKRLKSHSHEAWHPRSTPTSGAGSGASHITHMVLSFYHTGGSLFLPYYKLLEPENGKPNKDPRQIVKSDTMRM